MLLLPLGLPLTGTEHSCLLHLVGDPEAWMVSTLAEKTRLRRDALISDWRPTLYADATLTELPSSPDELATLILARSDYQTRTEQDEAADPPVEISTHNTDRYEAVNRRRSTIRLFPRGISLPDLAGNIILSYVQTLEEWVYGALMGQINRGKKKILKEYLPHLIADPDVSAVPAEEDQLVAFILSRSDYQALKTG